jgi:CheY-like chemotaxis protein
MPQTNHEPFATSVLLIDGSQDQRAYWADQLKRCSPNYEIVEASDGQSGLDLYRSRRIDCVVLALSLPDQSGFQTLVELVPIASRPEVAVFMLTRMHPARPLCSVIPQLASKCGLWHSIAGTRGAPRVPANLAVLAYEAYCCNLYSLHCMRT